MFLFAAVGDRVLHVYIPPDSDWVSASVSMTTCRLRDVSDVSGHLIVLRPFQTPQITATAENT